MSGTDLARLKISAAEVTASLHCDNLIGCDTRIDHDWKAHGTIPWMPRGNTTWVRVHDYKQNLDLSTAD